MYSRLGALNKRGAQYSGRMTRIARRHGNLYLQNRSIFDVLFAKGVLSGFLHRVAVEYAYTKYLGLLGHIRSLFGGSKPHQEQMAHFAIPLLRRSNTKLIPLDDSMQRLQHQYQVLSQQPDSGDIALVVNIGKKKQGKSLNATISSIMLSNNGGCAFPINMSSNYDFPTTTGIDISPPLPVTCPLPHSYHIPKRFDIGNIKYLCFMDIEGVNMKEIDHRLDVLDFISQTFLQRVSCMLMLSSLLNVDENDILILQKLYGVYS